ncbi:hypothetical protein WISP_102756 [Willisornis vidua]|uniref:Uncharacterized protein n=1 Tax=Willisornis vidua TaxID=1566151 RepID=A0ABQ9CXZ7_9PASS|nr:hypothetical protein WISP_102756 [Willisornis vidua]
MSVDEGRATDIIYPDFCKASDIVPHNILLSKLKRGGFNQWTVKWIRKWLDRHIQNKGVKCTLSKFADDTKFRGEIPYEIPTVECHLEGPGQDQEVGISCSFNKTKFKVLGQDNPQYQYRLEDEQIKSSSAKKDLIVLVDERMDITRQYALAESQLYPGLHQKQRDHQVEGVASIQKLPAASVLTDINFPMKGRKGMVDWARNSEDRVVIPKNIFTPMSTELDESTVFVLGAVLYKNLELILPTLRNFTVVNSKIIVVTIRPEPKTTDSFLEIELAHLSNPCKTLKIYSRQLFVTFVKMHQANHQIIRIFKVGICFRKYE